MQCREKRQEARGMMDKLTRKITRLEGKVGHVDWQACAVMAEDEGDWTRSWFGRGLRSLCRITRQRVVKWDGWRH